MNGECLLVHQRILSEGLQGSRKLEQWWRALRRDPSELTDQRNAVIIVLNTIAQFTDLDAAPRRSVLYGQEPVG